MKDLKAQLKQAKRALQKQRRADIQARAEARERAERDDWKSFKKECVELKNRR